MLNIPGRILVFQTAFTGDVVLTLPMVQTLRKLLPEILIDVVAVPSGAQVLENHPAINNVIVYDKKGEDRGFVAATKLASRLRKTKYDAALIPHRSFRSAAICSQAGIPRRIGFDTSAAPWLFTDKVPYDKNRHEAVRNMHLLLPLGYDGIAKELPSLYPSDADRSFVNGFIADLSESMVALAPGSVWATKRWRENGFADLARQLIDEHFSVVLVGGKEDIPIASRIQNAAGRSSLFNAAGKLTLLQSAELIRRSKVLVSNDSAPMHLAVAMRTPVVAIFGATVPEFGFAPLGEHDVVVETRGLKCRPCGIHGGNVCPIKTFDCMQNIRMEDIISKVHAILSTISVEAA